MFFPHASSSHVDRVLLSHSQLIAPTRWLFCTPAERRLPSILLDVWKLHSLSIFLQDERNVGKLHNRETYRFVWHRVLWQACKAHCEISLKLLMEQWWVRYHDQQIIVALLCPYSGCRSPPHSQNKSWANTRSLGLGTLWSKKQMAWNKSALDAVCWWSQTPFLRSNIDLLFWHIQNEMWRQANTRFPESKQELPTICHV